MEDPIKKLVHAAVLGMHDAVDKHMDAAAKLLHNDPIAICYSFPLGVASHYFGFAAAQMLALVPQEDRQNALEELLDLTRQTIYDWLNNGGNPDAPH